MTSGADHERGIDGIGVHARLVVVVHGDKSPVCNDTGDAEGAVGVGAGDEIFDCGCVEQLDVGEGEDFGEEGRGEKGLEVKELGMNST